eukprot:SAG11_NODE_11209_length_776_cov_1.221566_1_plen_179_part_10
MQLSGCSGPQCICCRRKIFAVQLLSAWRAVVVLLRSSRLDQCKRAQAAPRLNLPLCLEDQSRSRVDLMQGRKFCAAHARWFARWRRSVQWRNPRVLRLHHKLQASEMHRFAERQRIGVQRERLLGALLMRRRRRRARDALVAWCCAALRRNVGRLQCAEQRWSLARAQMVAFLRWREVV